MMVQMLYRGRSAIVNGLRDAHVLFAANQKRDPTFFRGNLAEPLIFREALAALYQVVVSDYKYRPKDRLAFQAWLAEQDRKFLAGLGIRNKKARARMEELENRLDELKAAQEKRRHPYHHARDSYFNYLYEKTYEQKCLFDPVITIHPDEISFEAFSRDESTYVRLAAKYELFNNVEEFECGTTNIDFGKGLHAEMEKLRSYRQTQFDISQDGLAVASAAQSTQRKKVDLPESWILGFLQVHSTMTLGLTQFHMAPVDLFNICRYLRRHKTKKSPRALRYELVPGQPVRAILEPWEFPIELTAACPLDGGRPFSLEMTPGALYQGNKPTSIRTWGRDRLQSVARLLPACRRIDVYLAGYGLPTIYVMDLGPITFTLALSGWTDNDWTGGKAKFDLLTREAEVNEEEITLTYNALKSFYLATEGTLANETGLTIEKTRSALSHLCQVGRAMYDLGGTVYRHRELFAEPFTKKEAEKAIKTVPSSSPAQKSAQQMATQGHVMITSRRPVSTGFKLTGSAKGKDGKRARPMLHVNHEGQIIEAECTCRHYKKYKMTQGPCEHVTALRIAHMNR